MRGRTCSRSLVGFLPLAFAVLGCAHGSEPLDLTSPNPASDQRKIANYYSREAEFFRLKADELSQRIVVYEGLFGPDSEWVKGAPPCRTEAVSDPNGWAENGKRHS